MRVHRLNAALLSPSRASSLLQKTTVPAGTNNDRNPAYAHQRRPDQQPRVALAIGCGSAVDRPAPSSPCLGHCHNMPDTGRGYAWLRTLFLAAGAVATDDPASVRVSAIERAADQPSAE